MGQRTTPATGVAFLALCALLLGACAPGTTDPAVASGRALPSSDGSALHLGLENTLPRSSTFAGVEFTVVAAEVTNVPPLSFGGDPTPGPNLIARLQLTARNLGEAAVRYRFTNAAFRLRTYSGQLLASSDETGLRLQLNLSPGTTDEADLYYLVPGQDSLTGAVLLIGEPPDAPSAIPLTGKPAEPRYPLALGAIGGSAHAGPVRWQVRSAMLGQDLPVGVCCPDTGERADDGELFLTISIRGTVDGSRYGQASITSHEVEVLIDGASIGQSFGFSGQANVAEGESYDFDATWLVRDDARDITVRFSSSDGQVGTVQIPVPES